MPATSCERAFPDAAANLIQRIDSIVRWLPRHERVRGELIAEIESLESSLTEPAVPARHVLRLYACALQVTGGPLRNVLRRRVKELCRLYGLTEA